MSKPLLTKRKDGHEIRFDEETSRRMAGIRRRDTKPEIVVRKLIHELGHRYRVHNKDLPGSPDIANRTRRWAVFVHGCFWHRHGCRATTTPTRNGAFWEAKFAQNVERDRRNARALRNNGFRVIVVWECQTKCQLRSLKTRLGRLLGSR